MVMSAVCILKMCRKKKQNLKEEQAENDRRLKI